MTRQLNLFEKSLLVPRIVEAQRGLIGIFTDINIHSLNQVKFIREFIPFHDKLSVIDITDEFSRIGPHLHIYSRNRNISSQRLASFFYDSEENPLELLITGNPYYYKNLSHAEAFERDVLVHISTSLMKVIYSKE